jgi:hypothetical protein
MLVGGAPPNYRGRSKARGIACGRGFGFAEAGALG